MRPQVVLIITLALLGSLAGGVLFFKKEKEIVIESVPTSVNEIPGAGTTTEDIDNEELIQKSEELIVQVQTIILETQKFLEEEKKKMALIEEAQEKSGKVKGIYVGTARNSSYFKNLLDETELNGLVIDVKEAYGQNLPVSLKNLIEELHKKEVWVIARAVLFRDSSLIEEKPEWYLKNVTSSDLVASTTAPGATTSDLWQDGAKQYWLDPASKEVQDYIIEFSKKVIDYGFDELQFDYIRYPDNYDYVSGQEKIKVIGDFFSKLSDSLRPYKPSIILSVDLFGYVATQFNSYGTGQRLFDTGKYFDYLSFMLYPSHFYGGFSAKGVSHFYPEVVEHPYDVIYYSVASARDYLSLFDLKTKIRPWLQDFDLKIDKDRGVFYDAEKVRAQINAAQNATSSGWLLWNSSYAYTQEALGTE